jgi:hypothetical protein
VDVFGVAGGALERRDGSRGHGVWRRSITVKKQTTRPVGVTRPCSRGPSAG